MAILELTSSANFHNILKAVSGHVPILLYGVCRKMRGLPPILCPLNGPFEWGNDDQPGLTQFLLTHIFFGSVDS